MTAASVAAEIRKAVGDIWTAAPADLAGLTDAHRPPSRDMVKRLYANFDLYWTAGFLFFASRHLRAEAGGWAQARGLLGAMIATCARRLELWNCAAAASVLRSAAGGIGEAETTAEGLEIVDAAVLYLNRLQSWVDTTIPWSALDAVPPLGVQELRK